MSGMRARDWTAENQAFLTAALARVRGAIERHFARASARIDHAGDAAPPVGSAVPDVAVPEGLSPQPALELVVERFGLSGFERDLLLMCAGVEPDTAFAALCREAGGDAGPTFSLALAALPGAHWSAITPRGPLRFWRMVEVRPSEVLVTAPLRIDERILHVLAGVAYTDERLQWITRPHAVQHELPAAHRAIAGRMAALWAAANDEPWPPLQLVGEEDAGVADVAAEACRQRGLDLRVIRAHDVPGPPADRQLIARIWEREATLAGSALLVLLDDADQADTQRAVAALVERTRVALIVAGREPLRQPGRTLPHFDVHKPDRAEQAALWRRALAGIGETVPEDRDGAAAGRPISDDCIDRLVNQFNLGPAAIATASAMVSQAPDAAPEAVAAQLWETCRGQARSRLDDLAQRVETTATWDDLVLPAFQMQILRDIVVNVRQRARVYDQWGFAAKSSRGLGIGALFAGASGTGKTLAAEIMANELHLDLYRIDLSQVVSKYIGETEKNLRRVFDAAETAGAVLLFDEADALFGKRSEVKDSHDRYANIEVSYLLQRMEAYRGLAILTTNMKQALDQAFMRRIRFIVQFPFPDAAERAEIWKRVFPAATPTADLDVVRLARLNVAGGNIRNIALGAAFLAADERAPVSMAHLLRVARAEYAKIDRPLTESEIGGWG
jgi:ATPase family associated with various cellular activities (AAA)/Winged helix domain, variant